MESKDKIDLKDKVTFKLYSNSRFLANSRQNWMPFADITLTGDGTFCLEITRVNINIRDSNQSSSTNRFSYIPPSIFWRLEKKVNISYPIKYGNTMWDGDGMLKLITGVSPPGFSGATGSFDYIFEDNTPKKFILAPSITSDSLKNLLAISFWCCDDRSSNATFALNLLNGTNHFGDTVPSAFLGIDLSAFVTISTVYLSSLFIESYVEYKLYMI